MLVFPVCSGIGTAQELLTDDDICVCGFLLDKVGAYRLISTLNSNRNLSQNVLVQVANDYSDTGQLCNDLVFTFLGANDNGILEFWVSLD